LSTFTKILIVLLTISSIFLCGIVVTYVANADSYRDDYNTLKREADALRETEAAAVKARNEKDAELTRKLNEKNSEISALNTQISTLKGQFEDAERRNANLLLRVDKFAAEVETFNKTNNETSQMMKEAQDAFKKADAERIKLGARLDETSQTLLEKLAIIQSLETDKKRLIEEKTELQARMDKLLQPVGKTTSPVVTVTQEKEIARPTPVVTEKIALKGLITAVDLKNKLASISIGTADGVKEGMKFHVTRVDQAICDILIIDADTEQSVGALELLDIARAQPKPGDTVTTNL
jgi:septal ring factor EnvC (AmiA/AmiB activator)